MRHLIKKCPERFVQDTFIEINSYFPTQKRSKMRATMSSRAVWPVSSPRAFSAWLYFREYNVGRHAALERALRRTDAIKRAADGVGLTGVCHEGRIAFRRG